MHSHLLDYSIPGTSVDSLRPIELFLYCFHKTNNRNCTGVRVDKAFRHESPHVHRASKSYPSLRNPDGFDGLQPIESYEGVGTPSYVILQMWEPFVLGVYVAHTEGVGVVVEVFPYTAGKEFASVEQPRTKSNSQVEKIAMRV